MPKEPIIIKDTEYQTDLLKKKSIFSKLGAVNFFPDTNASGFTLNKEKTEYKYIRDGNFINSGKLSVSTSPSNEKSAKIVEDDPSKLIKKKSIFSNISVTNFFPNTNATGFTKNKKESEYKHQYNGVFINSGKLSTPFINSVDYFSGTQGIWGSGTLPFGFTIKQDKLPLHNKSLFFISTDEIKIGKSKNPYGLALPSVLYTVGNFKLKSQLGLLGSSLFGHVGFNINDKYTKGSGFGEVSLVKNSLFDANKPQEKYTGDISFDYRTIKNIYGTSVFDVKLGQIINDRESSKYWEAFEDFNSSVPNQGDIGLLPHKLFKDGSNLNTYYKKASSSTDKLSILNNPSRGRLLFSEPYIRTHIGERYGFFNDISDTKILTEKGEDIISVSDFLTRGGVTTAISRTIEDTMRIGKFLLSERGILFTIKQVGLQRMSPRQETRVSSILESVTFAGSFNLNMLASTAMSAFGIRTARHAGPFPLSAPKTYEESIKNEIEDNFVMPGNRLRFLKSHLLEKALGIYSGIIPLSSGVTPGVSNHMHGVYGIIPSTLGIVGFTRVTNSLKVGSDIDMRNLSFIPPGYILTGKNKSKSYKNYRRYADIEDIAKDSEGERLTIYETLKKENSAKDGWDTSIKNDLKVHDMYLFEFGIRELYADTLGKNIKFKENNIKKHDWENNVNRGESYLNKLDASDPIKAINRLTEADGENFDICVLKFRPYGGKAAILFRAIVDSYSDQYSPSYTTVNYVGNPINYPIYQNTKRTISLSFKVPLVYSEDVDIVKGRLNMLATYCWPATQGSNKRISTPFIQFTYGDLVKDSTAVITGITFTVDTNTPWELTRKFPHIISVTVNMDIIPDIVPFAGEVDSKGLPNYWFIGQEPTENAISATYKVEPQTQTGGLKTPSKKDTAGSEDAKKAAAAAAKEKAEKQKKGEEVWSPYNSMQKGVTKYPVMEHFGVVKDIR